MKAAELIRQLAKEYGTPAERKLAGAIIEAMGIGNMEVPDSKVKTIKRVGDTLKQMGVK